MHMVAKITVIGYAMDAIRVGGCYMFRGMTGQAIHLRAVHAGADGIGDYGSIELCAVVPVAGVTIIIVD